MKFNMSSNEIFREIIKSTYLVENLTLIDFTEYFSSVSEFWIFHTTVWNFTFRLTLKILREIEFDKFLQTSIAKFNF